MAGTTHQIAHQSSAMTSTPLSASFLQKSKEAGMSQGEESTFENRGLPVVSPPRAKSEYKSHKI
eukprot:scaffold115913_cov68-Attheya_sp.AAC.5